MASKPPLGRLEPVNLRANREREESEFTPWLAKQDNLALLGEILGLDLQLEAPEQQSRPGRANLLRRDARSAKLLLIGNRLERTDNSHLGQVRPAWRWLAEKAVAHQALVPLLPPRDEAADGETP